MSETSKTLELKYSHNIIEHLGLKLYQNKPTNVIAELVSNAWDACAKNVYIDFDYSAEIPYLSVIDDGSGMTPDVLQDSYLVIGKSKRAKDDECTSCGELGTRKPMGRKGIGKLAPFGIAKEVHVLTVSKNEDGKEVMCWIGMDIEAILHSPVGEDGFIATYEPNVVLYNELYDAEKLKVIGTENGFGASVDKFVSSIKTTGTMIMLKNFSVVHKITDVPLIESMGRRFTVTLLRDDFKVFVNGTKIEEKNALPEFEYRLPEGEGSFQTETIGGKEIKYWVGFVKKAEWPADQAGVGVYAHGKIAQDRPFAFGDKGHEITVRYMYAVIEADWIDELPKDLVSTDRTSIDWEMPETQSLHTWGAEKVKKWISGYKEFKRRKEEGELQEEILRKIADKKIPKITAAEQSLLTKMLADVYTDIGKDEKVKDKVLHATAEAWTRKPMKEMVKTLWDKMKKEENRGENFADIVESLNSYAIPEALALSVTFAQRAYALNLLYQLIHAGREIDLQKLIEKFPWIINPEMEKLSANEALTTMMKKAAERGLNPGRFQHELSGREGVDGGKKPDFVFLSDGPEREFCVVEIKHPLEAITIDNREQLNSYLTHLESVYPTKKRSGILIGNNTHNIENNNTRVTFLTWDEVFSKSRLMHIEFLSSMLKQSAVEVDDEKMSEIKHFGGKETVELLQRISNNSDEMKSLLHTFAGLDIIETFKVNLTSGLLPGPKPE